MSRNKVQINAPRGPANTAPTCMGYLLNPLTGAVLQQLGVSSISRSVHSVIDGVLTAVQAPTTVTVAAAIFDTLQTTNELWNLSLHDEGFNFLDQPARTLFADPSTRYVISYLITPATGQAFIERFVYGTDALETV